MSRISALAFLLLAASVPAAASPAFTQAGDGDFRSINAVAGRLSGVDVTGAVVSIGGVQQTLAAIALEAAQAVPLSLAGRVGGWLQLDQSGLVPAALINPASIATDMAARNAATSAMSAANAAQQAAAAAVPLSMGNVKNGFAQLDGNAMVQTAAINPASVATDPTARGAASSAMSAANAAQSMAAAAVPLNTANAKNGFAQLDGNAMVPTALINPASVATDSTARNAASSAMSAANAAQSTAANAVPLGSANAKNGYAQLDGNAMVPTVLINPASVATDSTARNAASNAVSVANAAQSAAAAAVPSNTANAKNGYAQLDGNALIPTALINPASVATDSTARNAASSAMSAANAAQTAAANAVPSNTANAKNGYAQLDGNALVPTSLINPASVATDSTARSAASNAVSTANAAQSAASNAVSTANAAQSAAAAAVPSNTANAKNGYAQLDSNALVPTSLINPASVATDSTARSAANNAVSTANAAQTAANNAVPLSTANAKNGYAQLDGNAMVPTSLINPASVATDSTARSAANNAVSTANAAQTAANNAVPLSTANAKNGYAQLDGNAMVPTSLINPASVATDSTARSAANNAVSTANSAQSAASNAVSTANSAQSAAAAAIPSSTLGHANGPAVLDANATLSAAAADAFDAATTLTLQQHFGEVVDGAEQGMRCNEQELFDLTTTNGSTQVKSASYKFQQSDVGDQFSGEYQMNATQTTIASVNADGSAVLANAATYTSSTAVADFWHDDTSAFQAAVNAAIARAGTGADIQLPAGTCALSGTVSGTFLTSVRLIGRGAGATRIEQHAAADALVFTIGNGASFTSVDYSIDKRVGANNGKGTFVGRGLAVIAQVGSNNLPNGGDVTIARMSIYPNTPASQTDGWASDVYLSGTANATLFKLDLSEPGYTNLPLPSPNPNNYTNPAQALGNPGAPGNTSTPQGLGIGLADNVTITAPSGMYAIDTKISHVSTGGGLAGIDADNIQGIYVVNSSFVAPGFGVRASDATGSGILPELVMLEGNHFNAALDGVYLNGIGGATITGNYFLHFGSGAGLPAYAEIWARNSSAVTATGNSGAGNGSAATSGEYGVALTADSAGGYAGFANSVIGNVFYAINGYCLYNDANTIAVIATGNAGGCAAGNASTEGYYDGTGSNAYANNMMPYADLYDDGHRDVRIAKNLSCGGPYDNCNLTVFGSGARLLATDGFGDLAAGGGVTLGAVGTGGLRTVTEAAVFGTAAAGTPIYLTPTGAVPQAMPASTTASAAAASGATSVSVGATTGVLVGMVAQDTTSNARIGVITAVAKNALSFAATGSAVASGDAVAFLLGPSEEIGANGINIEFGTLHTHLNCMNASNYNDRFTIDLDRQYSFYASREQTQQLLMSSDTASTSVSTTLAAAGSTTANTLSLASSVGLRPDQAMQVSDSTHTAAIAAGTVLSGLNGTTATLTAMPASAPASGDTIVFATAAAPALPAGVTVGEDRYGPDGSPLVLVSSSAIPLACSGLSIYVAGYP